MDNLTVKTIRNSQLIYSQNIKATAKNKLSEINGWVGCVSAIKPNYTQKLFILTHPTV